MNDTNNMAQVVEAGAAMTKLEDRMHNVDGIPFVLLNSGQNIAVLKEVVAAWQERQPRPLRRKGTSKHQELLSFIDFTNQLKDERTACWADAEQMTMTAIFNYALQPGAECREWADHRAVYKCPRAPEWQTWTSKSGVAMGQDEFADHLEMHLEDVVGGKKDEGYPLPPDLLLMTRSLHVQSKVVYKRDINPVTGEYTLISKQENTGDTTATVIPRAFLVGIPVFLGGQKYKVEARVRFLLRDGRATFQYDLHRWKEIERDAFGDMRKEVQKATGLPVFCGEPEPT